MQGTPLIALLLPHPPHHPKPRAHSFPQPDARWQRHIRLEVEREAQHLDALVLHPVAFEEVGEFQVEAFGELPAHARGEGQNLGREQPLQEGELLGDAGERAELLVILRVEGLPVVEAVAQGLLGGAQRVLVHVQAGDAQRLLLCADAQVPVGLTEKVVGLLYALLEAEQHGAHLVAYAVGFVLDERVALVVAAMLVVVVVVPLVLKAHLAGYRAPEGGQFPGRHMGIERNGKDSEERHLEL